MMQLWMNLAQTTTAPSAQPSPWAFLQGPFVPLILAMVVLWWFMSRGRTKERDRYRQMLSSLKKNDRVQTIGGILGTVVDVRDNDVILKVDENSNVKIRFNKTAIKEVLHEPAPTESKS